MAKIFITGSSDGLGFLTAEALILQNHKVFVHARNERRAKDLAENLPGTEDIFIAELSDLEQVKKLADKVNSKGKFDAIIHNAGIFSGEHLFTVNVLAPYVLTAKIENPNRLIYLSSTMHNGGCALKSDAAISDVNYSDSKLQLTMLMRYVSKKFKGIYVNAVNPGWVPTKMGGAGAPDNLQQGYKTQVWLATSEDSEAKVSGKYFYHQRRQEPHSNCYDTEAQEQLISICEKLSGVEL